MSDKKVTKEDLFDLHIHSLMGKHGQAVKNSVDEDPHLQKILDDYSQLETYYKNEAGNEPSPKVLKNILKRAQSVSPTQKPSFFWVYKKSLALSFTMLVAIGLSFLVSPTPDQEKIAFQDKNTPQFLTQSPNLYEAASGATNILPSSNRPQGPIVNASLTSVSVPPPSAVEANLNAQLDMDEMEQIKVQDSWVRKHLRQAQLLIYQGHFDEAQSIFKKLWATNLPTKHKQTVLFQWAECLEKMGSKKQALVKLYELQEINSLYPGLEASIKRCLQ